MTNYARLRRVRFGVRAVLILGVVASVSANILHADPNPISRTISAWPPLALLITVEVISRVPVSRRSVAAVRIVATALIAGIAGWVSYWHMVAVAARYGEDGATPYLPPISVDGLIVVASVSLVELAAGLRRLQEADPVRTQVAVVEPMPVLTVDELLDAALSAVADYRTKAGKPISRDELRAAVGVGAEKAGALLPAARGERLNGHDHGPLVATGAAS